MLASTVNACLNHIHNIAVGQVVFPSICLTALSSSSLSSTVASGEFSEESNIVKAWNRLFIDIKGSGSGFAEFFIDSGTLVNFLSSFL